MKNNSIPFIFNAGLLALLTVLGGCDNHANNTGKSTASRSYVNWRAVKEDGRGSTVNMMMWKGDPQINQYMHGYVVPAVKKQFGINLQISPGQGAEVVSLLMSEKDVGAEQSEIDLMWINGETFYQLRQLDALFGPFTRYLPNDSLIDWDNPFIAKDFQQAVNDMECPWGNVQLAFIYDSSRINSQPPGFADIGDFVKKHPGTFTLPTEFTGMTVLKSWMISMAPEGALSGKFDKQAYQKYSGKLWREINGMKQYFWKQGKTYPSELSQLHQLFANGEVDFTFSNNDSEADNKIRQGLFPKTATAYVPAPGTIQNSHYLGIPRRASNINGALTVVNFLISPRAQYKKANPGVWGDGTVLDVDELPSKWQEKFGAIPSRRHGPSRSNIRANAFQELAPKYMTNLYDDFREYVIDAD